jgi:hypothetical protein
VWPGLDPYVGQSTIPKFTTLEDGNSNAFLTVEIDIFLRY